MDLISAREAAKRWGISPTASLRHLCSEGRIEQAAFVGNMWVIPEDAKKPQDGRSLRYVKSSGPNCKVSIFEMGRW